jgi:hypothetical protein
VIALPTGGVAMHDLSVGNLVVFDAAGTAGASGAFGGRWGYQSALGIWMSAEDAQMSARVSLPLNAATTSFRYLGAVGTGQRAPSERVYATRETAALLALQYLEVLTNLTGHEYGGMVCERPKGFEWSELKTSNLKDRIEPADMPPTLCNAQGTYAAFFHTHPLPDELPHFSGPDLDRVQQHPGIPHYLLAPRPTDPPGGIPTSLRTLKTWNSDANRQRHENTCVRQGNGAWLALYPGGRCDTPNP